MATKTCLPTLLLMLRSIASWLIHCRSETLPEAADHLKKTDAIDAAVLARFGRQVEPKLREKPTPSQRKLRALVARRAAVLSQFGAECNRKDQTAEPAVLEMNQQAIDFYKTYIKDLDRQITSLIDAVERFHNAKSMEAIGLFPRLV